MPFPCASRERSREKALRSPGRTGRLERRGRTPGNAEVSSGRIPWARLVRLRGEDPRGKPGMGLGRPRGKAPGSTWGEEGSGGAGGRLTLRAGAFRRRNPVPSPKDPGVPYMKHLPSPRGLGCSVYETPPSPKGPGVPYMKHLPPPKGPGCSVYETPPLAKRPGVFRI
jgi:hypothetical protein